MSNFRKRPALPSTSATPGNFPGATTSPVIPITPLQPRTLRVAEVAAYLGITISLTRALIKNGALPAIRLGKRDLIMREDADAFLNRQRERVAA